MRHSSVEIALYISCIVSFVSGFVNIGLHSSTAQCSSRSTRTQAKMTQSDYDSGHSNMNKVSRRKFGSSLLGIIGIGLAVPFSAVADEDVAILEPDVPQVEPMTAAVMPSTEPPVPAAAPKSAYDFTMLYNGKSYPLSKFLGPKGTIIVNCKLDDPATLEQMPDITAIASKYAKEGLHVLLVPTDQGTFEADEDRVVKIKFYQFYGFGQYPVATVVDKVDIVGNTSHPLYKYMCRTLKNPNGIGRVTLNYEKFLLDGEGHPVRRYPRKLQLSNVEDDIIATIRGKPLPPPSRDYVTAWLKAKAEAERSEYAFKLGLNYYNNASTAQ